MHRGLLPLLFYSAAASASPKPPGLPEQAGMRMRSTYLGVRSALSERWGYKQVQHLRAALPRGLDAAADFYIESPIRRSALAAHAKEYRALRRASGAYAERRRGALASIVGSYAVIRSLHDQGLRSSNTGVAYPGSPDGEVLPMVSIEPMSRAKLTNVLAHELKHVRDFPLIDAAIERTTQLVRATDQLLASPESAERNREISKNQRTITRLQDFATRPAQEMRAYRAGGFAQGLMGESLVRLHRTGEYSDWRNLDYPPDLLAHATMRGYLAGSKRALRLDPRFRTADLEKRAQLTLRLRAYLLGYQRVIEAQADKSLYVAPSPRGKVAKLASAGTAALGHALGWLDQKLRPIRSDDAAFEAGRRDATYELAPLARASTLLR